MDARREPPSTSSLELVRWIGWAQRKAGEDWIRERELSHEQGFVLGYLVQNPGAIQRDIAQISRTSAASVSSLLQGLERRGLVERRTEDGDERSKRVYATPAGAELIAGFDAAMAARRRDDPRPAGPGRAGHPARPAHEDHRGAAATDPLVDRRSRPRAAPAAIHTHPSPRRRPPARARTCPEKEPS